MLIITEEPIAGDGGWEADNVVRSLDAADIDAARDQCADLCQLRVGELRITEDYHVGNSVPIKGAAGANKRCVSTL